MADKRVYFIYRRRGQDLIHQADLKARSPKQALNKFFDRNPNAFNYGSQYFVNAESNGSLIEAAGSKQNPRYHPV